MPNINRTIERLKELVKAHKEHMATLRGNMVFNDETRKWAKQIRAAFIEEVMQLIERL